MICSVISFCTTEWRFLEACINSVRPFSSQILITVCDHFFNGEPENYTLLEETYRRFPDVTFLVFAYDPEKTYQFYTTLTADHPHARHAWHNTGRWLSLFFLNEGITTLYFCDADEVTDTTRFTEWLNGFDYTSYTVLRFSSYRYFREARFQAIEYDLTGTLVSRAALRPEHMWSEHERMGIYLEAQGDKLLDVKGLDGEPLIHHYSWVRTQEEMQQKAVCWGHYWERNWQQLIEEEFSRPFTGVDFVRKQQYVTVTPHFDPLLVRIPDPVKHVKPLDNVIRVTREEMFQKELSYEFQL